MGFSEKQVRALQRSVSARNIRTRHLNGRELPYIEGWHAIAEANRIFGFDGWDRETVESRCVIARDTRGTMLAIYTAKVRLTVRTEGATIVREGNGSGEARSNSPGEAHEIALKAAETDATKRALATFGRPFGLALYLNGRPRTAPQQTGAQNAPGDALSAGQHRSEPAGQHQELNGALPQSEQSAPVTASPADIAPTTIPSRIDKSMLMFGEPRRERDKHHLLFVGQQPCLLCNRVPSDAHHLRFAQPRAIGRKVGDQFTVPLCRTHHKQVHECSDEGAWWADLEIDAIEIAKGLWEQSRAKRAALIRSLPGAIDPLHPQDKP